MGRREADPPMASEVDHRLVHFEVHAERAGRWRIELVTPEEELACARGRQLLRQAEVAAVRVWKEVHDAATGQSAGRIVLDERKPPPRSGRWRFARWTAKGEREEPPEPDGYVRRNVAPPPPPPADWPLAALSIGGGCLALVALATLAALNHWAPLR